jgi:hypothetical protein
MRKQLIACAAIFVLSACGLLAAQSQQPASESYQWSGELVSFDETARTVTVKARLVDQNAIAELKRFKAGDRVLLFWSGFDKYADAIRSVMPYTADREDTDRFRLPVELVSTDAPNQYITFRLRVPDSSVGMVKPVKPGEWVTITSSHKASADTGAIVSIRPYTATSATTTSE